MQIQILVAELIKLYQSAKENDCMSEELVLEWTKFLLSIGEIEKAQEVAILGRSEHNRSVPMLKLQFQMEIMSYMSANSGSLHKNSKKLQNSLSLLLADALDEAKDETELLDIWILLKNYFISSLSSSTTVLKYLKVSILQQRPD